MNAGIKSIKWQIFFTMPYIRQLRFRAQRDAPMSNRRMQRRYCESWGQKLPADLVAAVNARLEAAAKSAAEQMVQKWSEADAAAASAAAVYTNAESRFTWKLVACLISSVVAIGIVFSTWIFCLTPTEATLHAQREEHRLLVSEIERLRGMGVVDIANATTTVT